jgi:trk system potassium uptake protein TrkH
VVLKVFTRIRKLSSFISSVITQPAQTIVLSFVLVIAVGTLVLMMPFVTNDGAGLAFVEALFTATSAVCVTGLIVVDTATVLTVGGQIVVLVLIQIGGLGIMILSFFTIYVFRRSVSVENKLLISYMLSEKNLNSLAGALKRIIGITFAIELAGAVLLLPLFADEAGSLGEGLFFAVFHAVSAFCNAGFALFSDSLVGFANRPAINAVIAALIIAGGLSFAVVSDALGAVGHTLREWGRRIEDLVRRRRYPRPNARYTLSVNSRAVLLTSGSLLLAGLILFYAIEHGRSLSDQPTGTQYLVSAFQSVTLRTAGFNTVDLGGLANTSYLAMMAIMFIGGASGSTAGGIKVNTVAVIVGYLRSLRRGEEQTVLFKHSIPAGQVATAFTVLVFGVVAVCLAAAVLALTEPFALVDILFESVSAFATVGLSTGITGGLSIAGRLVIIGLMFIGRLGPLTLFSALSARARKTGVLYPSADLSVG